LDTASRDVSSSEDYACCASYCSLVAKVDGMIKPGDVVRNKHYPHIICRTLPHNAKCFASVAPTGYLGYGDTTNPDHWEKASVFVWWNIAIRWYFRNIIWFLQYKMNRDLGLVGREVPVSVQDVHYRNANYFIYRGKLLFGVLSKEYL
jgi:hypothetical protein